MREGTEARSGTAERCPTWELSSCGLLVERGLTAMVSRPRGQRLRALWEAIAAMGDEDVDATIAALRVLRRDVAARERLRLALDGSPAAVAFALGAIAEPARRELSSPTTDLSDPALLARVDRLQRCLSNGLASRTRNE